MIESGLLDRLTIGDHVCWVVDDDHVRIRTLAAYVRAGLRDHHKIIYCGDAPDAVLAGIDALGVDTAAALAAGQLVAQPAAAAYVAGDAFDPAELLRGWRRTIDRARAEGYPGLRVLGDMTWASRAVPGTDRLPGYEAEINRFFVDHDVIGVCAYDKRIFDPLLLRQITWSHTGTATTGAPFDPELSLRVRRTRDPLGVRLEGEADLSNRNALRAVFTYLFEDAGASREAFLGEALSGEPTAFPGEIGEMAEVTVDVGGLRFADRAAARILVQAAGSGRRVRLTHCSPALVRLLDFNGAAAVADLTVQAEE